MILSRLVLNPLCRDVHRCLADAHRLHQTVMTAFGQGSTASAREEIAVLHRLDVQRASGRMILYVQSSQPPSWGRLPEGFLLDLGDELENPAAKDISSALAAVDEGMHLVFRLRANPTRKIDTKSGADGKRRNGHRVPLESADAKLAWLVRQGGNHGFVLSPTELGEPDVRVIEEPGSSGKRRDHIVSFLGTVFEGTLRATDLGLFKAALKRGIGPAKAYGFGLLSICPARRP